MKKMTELIGKATINPLLFYSGKFSGYFTWIVLLSSLLGIELIPKVSFKFVEYVACFLMGWGLLAIVISLINLGSSTRFGLPIKDTKFKTNGIYKISRNPMYVGFDLLTISAILITLHSLIIVMGIYSILIYHLIILGEERFLDKRFGFDYARYKQKVRRYI
jgi:protein-S-isoprenylcysteine O-methyltransferase Ste14